MLLNSNKNRISSIMAESSFLTALHLMSYTYGNPITCNTSMQRKNFDNVYSPLRHRSTIIVPANELSVILDSSLSLYSKFNPATQPSETRLSYVHFSPSPSLPSAPQPPSLTSTQATNTALVSSPFPHPHHPHPTPAARVTLLQRASHGLLPPFKTSHDFPVTMKTKANSFPSSQSPRRSSPWFLLHPQRGLLSFSYTALGHKTLT